MALDQSQIEAFEFLVEVARSPRAPKRQPIYGTRTLGSHNMQLIHPGVPEGHEGIYPADLDELAGHGLIRYHQPGIGTWHIEVTNRGYEFYATLHERSAAPMQASVQDSVSYLDGKGFTSRHPEAAKSWRLASGLLWGQDTTVQLTAVGHHCREALQNFAASTLRLCPTPSAPADPTKSVSRLRCVVAEHYRASSSVSAFLISLTEHFGAVSDLGQRQEHGGQKEGEPLSWEDARRVTMATLHVLSELDRALFSRT